MWLSATRGSHRIVVIHKTLLGENLAAKLEQDSHFCNQSLRSWAKMEKEKLARIVVFVVIAGLVGAYIPLLFAPKPAQQPPSFDAAQDKPQNEEAASLTPPPSQNTPALPADSQPASEPKKEETKSPDSFGGLEEEKDSLEDLDKLLE